jgi:hypothetical protein
VDQDGVATAAQPVLNSTPTMAAKKTPHKQSKSDFIRAQPGALSAAEVVAKAKEAGVTIDPALVYKVRGRASARTTKKPKKLSSSTQPASKKPASKADFVRAHRELSPQQIVEKARASSIKLDVGYVYNVRGSDKVAAKKRGDARVATARSSTNVPRPIITTSRVEDLLKAVAAELGLGSAIEILLGERARVRAVIGG